MLLETQETLLDGEGQLLLQQEQVDTTLVLNSAKRLSKSWVVAFVLHGRDASTREWARLCRRGATMIHVFRSPGFDERWAPTGRSVAQPQLPPHPRNLGMTYVPKVLFVAWQDAKSRRIIPVGRLLRLPDGFEFAYIGSVKRAQELRATSAPANC